MPEVQGRSGCGSCPDSWFACVGNSGHPGAGEGKPRSHKSHRGILLFYFQPCFFRHKGFQSRCISEAYLCEYLTAYLSRTKTFKPSEVYPSRALSPHVTIWLLAAAAWSLLLGASHLPPLCCSTAFSTATLWSQTPCHFSDGLCTACRGSCAAACSAASQHPDGLHLCCIPHIHTESGTRPEQSTLALPGPKNEEHLPFFLWDINGA